MSFDNHSNFGLATITVAPSPASSGTSLQVSDPNLFPTAPFNCTVFPAGVQPLASNAEIVRVTAIVGSTFTIVRAQEGTSAIAIAAGYQIANTTSKKVFTDIESAIPVQFVSNISAVGGSASAQVIFSNSNNVTFGINAGVVTASAGVGGGGAAISAGANSQSTGTVVFSNSNGVSFGLAAGILTASHNGITSQSVQTQGMVSINGSTGAIVFSNSNNVTFGGAGSVVTASASFAGLTSQSNQAASASNGSFTFQTLGFSNANNVTFGTSAGSIITASVATAAAGNSVNFSAGTTSNNLGSIVFSNSNNITFGLNGSTITASASAQSTQPVAASASNGSFLFSTLGFSNANGVSFGTSAGSIVTASVAGAAAARTAPSLWWPPTDITTIGAPVASNASVVFLPLSINASFTRIDLAFSQNIASANNNSTAAVNYSGTCVLLTQNASTMNSILSTTNSTFVSWTSNNTASASGAFYYSFGMATNLSPGNYWLAFQLSTAATGGTLTGAATTSLGNTITMMGIGSAQFGQMGIRDIGNSSANTTNWLSYQGVNSVTSNLTQIDVSNISQAQTAGNRAAVVMRFIG